MSIYACADLHGVYDLWAQIKEFLQPDDTLIFLGDAADRGTEGWAIIKELIEDERVVYLKGNHEDMLVDAMKEYYDDYENGDNAFDLLIYNGGYETFTDWQFNDSEDASWYHILKHLPTEYHYKSAYLSHSGASDPWNRKHIKETSVDGELIIIHGHTPVRYLKDYKPPADLHISAAGVARYCGDRKIDIDLMSAYSGKVVLLDLDTFAEIVFEEREN